VFRRRRARLPRQLPPLGIERDYRVAITRMVERMRASTKPVIESLRPVLEQARAERHDADESERIIALLRASLERTMASSDVKAMAEEVAHRVSVHNSKQLARQTRAALGVDVFTSDPKVPALTSGFVAENVALIRSIPAEVASKLEMAVTRAVASGTPWKQFATEVEDIHEFGSKRARAIARDQVGKLNGQINAARQREMGVRKFTWRTSNDIRVRGTPGGPYAKASPSHYDLEGQVFSYPEGHLIEGIPGSPINCRCYAEPLFSDEDEQEVA
jgi:SPP1 gp7 family putative phage head morphogenesis protein